MNQRGKNVVSASSGNTTSSQPWRGGLVEQREQALDDVACGRRSRCDRPELGGADRHDPAHDGGPSSEVRPRAPGRAARASSTSAPAVEIVRVGVLGRVVADAVLAAARRPCRPGTPGPASGRRGRRPRACGAREWPEPLRPSPRRGRPPARRTPPARSGPGVRAATVTPSAAASASATLGQAPLGLLQGTARRCCAGRRSASAAPATTLTRSGCRSKPADRADLVAAELERQLADGGDERGGHVARRRGGGPSGVVPAWFDWPVIVSSCQEMPCTPVTAPMVTPSASSTGPCSMCSSTNACGREARAGQRRRRSRCGRARRPAGRRRCPRRRGPPRAAMPPTNTSEPSMSGAKRAPSSSVKKPTASGRAGSTPACFSVSITSSPASTP